jgi:hypothetical protein
MSTFFKSKEARLKKKVHFETTGSNPSSKKEVDDMLTEIEKFDEILHNMQTSNKKDINSTVDKVEEALQNLLSLDWVESEISEDSSPLYILDVEDEFKWLYSVQRRTYVPVRAGSEVIPVTTENEGYFCVINNELFSVEEEWVSCVGWN